ncbi:MAG: LysR family transcriptional regulator, partial [Caulobacteraceae bacterium]|nr:LysR family transcriptional regulator [Caulobacteraceae bacterium]
MSVAASWDHIATFLAVMREGSLSGAARAQGVTQPTVRRQIEDLERDLGTTLFARTPNGLIPTPAARVMLPYADSMRSSAEALARAARSDAERPTGTVRV